MTAITYTHSPSLTPLATQPPQSISSSSNPPIDHLMTSVLVLRQSHSQDKPQPQILLLRRSPTDSYPLKWEPPGGSVDPADASVLSAAARELHEEARLSGAHFHAWVAMAREIDPGDASRMENWGVLPEDEKARDVDVRVGETVARVTTFWETREVWGKMNFVATVEGGEVVIDPEEHVEWGWFAEEEVRRGRAAAAAAAAVNGDGTGIGEEKTEERVLEFTSQTVWGSVLEAFRVGRELGVIV